MKRILFTIAAVGALMAASCQSSTEKAAESQAVDFKTKIENCSNPDSIKIFVEQAIDHAKQLANSGKAAEAEAYLNDIQAAVASKAPEMKSYFEKVETSVDDKAAEMANKAKEAEDSLKAKADDAKDAAVKAADKAKDKTANAIDDAAKSAKSAIGR